MTRYFIDCEFLEDGKTIDLLSIGVVREDGTTYYAQNEECHFKQANEWVIRHVFPQLKDFDLRRRKPEYHSDRPWAGVWRDRKTIADELDAFVCATKDDKPEFWGYYSAYDWVAIAQLFGPMALLPPYWPFYCNDIKQWEHKLGGIPLPKDCDGAEHNALQDALWNQRAYAYLADYERAIQLRHVP